MGGNPIARLRLVGWLEGISFVLLLFVAMPLKYLADQPAAVRYTGLAHGVLFIAYGLCLLQAASAAEWPLRRTARFGVAALLPFGPFLVHGELVREERALLERETAAG